MARRRVVPPSAEEVQQFTDALRGRSEAEKQLLLGALMVINQHGVRHLVEWIDRAHASLHQPHAQKGRR